MHLAVVIFLLTACFYDLHSNENSEDYGSDVVTRHFSEAEAMICDFFLSTYSQRTESGMFVMRQVDLISTRWSNQL